MAKKKIGQAAVDECIVEAQDVGELAEEIRDAVNRSQTDRLVNPVRDATSLIAAVRTLSETALSLLALARLQEGEDKLRALDQKE